MSLHGMMDTIPAILYPDVVQSSPGVKELTNIFVY